MDEDAEAFVLRLRRDHDTSVAPGRFFERPDRFRVGLAGDPANTRAGLERLAQALETGDGAGVFLGRARPARSYGRARETRAVLRR